MKKLMIAASAALCATVGFSDVTSANVVGYLNKTDTRKDFNYVTPPFRPVGGGDTSIQDIQLDKTVISGQADIQWLNEGCAKASLYNWYTLADAKKNGVDTTPYEAKGLNGIWMYYKPKTKSSPAVIIIPSGEDDLVEVGDGLQISLPAVAEGADPYQIQFNGQVGEDDMFQHSRAGFNYVGNPYAAPISIQDIQLDTTAISGQPDIQRLNDGAAKEFLYGWYTLEDAQKNGVDITPYEGLNGIWMYYKPKTKSSPAVITIPSGDHDLVPAGAALQVQTPTDGIDITVLCPYDL